MRPGDSVDERKVRAARRFTWIAPDNKLDRVQDTKQPAIDLMTTTPDDFPQFLGPDRSCWIAGPKLARDWTEQPPEQWLNVVNKYIPDTG